MKFSGRRATFACVVAVFGVWHESGATSCDATEYRDHIARAEWVVIGTAVDARFVGGDRSAIRFVLSEIDSLRGDPPASIELETNVGAYNPKVTIGDRFLAYIDPQDRFVNYCRRFLKYDPEHFFEALLHRKKGDCGLKHEREIAAAAYLQAYHKDGAPMTRSRLVAQLNDVVQVATDLTYLVNDTSLTVKGIQFVFDGETLSEVAHVACSEPE